MGDRANIQVKDAWSPDQSVFLYSHWGGSTIGSDLQRALRREQRWDDHAYLTRIIFDTMTEGEHGQETGYGISAQVGDGDDRIWVVDTKAQTVTAPDGHSWSFEDFANAPSDEPEAHGL